MLFDDASYARSNFGQACFVVGIEHGFSDGFAHQVEVIDVQTARGCCGSTHADSAGYEGRTRLVRNGVLVHRQANGLKHLFGVFARDVGIGQVDQAQMIVGATRDQAQAFR